MSTKSVLAAGLALAFAGMAQAQALSCSCDSTAVRLDQAALAALLGNKMVCASLGNETWQEWHNGSTSGPLVDYKLGPTDPRDPSKPVGTFGISGNLVTYSYTGGGSYSYEVCSATNGTYTFCGQRVITNARIGGSGLQSCSAVSNLSIVRSTTSRR